MYGLGCRVRAAVGFKVRFRVGVRIRYGVWSRDEGGNSIDMVV